jgi:hypothetical protein
MSTLERELELGLGNIDKPFSYNRTPKTIIATSQFSSYINNRLASAIDGTIELSPSVSRAIEKRDKGTRIMLFQGLLVDEELKKKREVDKLKASRKARGRQVQKYRIISVRDARLRMIARDEAQERRIELYNLQQEQKEAERHRVLERKEERLRKIIATEEAKKERQLEREAKAKVKEEAEAEKALEKARKKAEQEAKAVSRLAITQ